ncbi:MAG: hypothetical protein AM325_005110 [Candidatus Thorarchaeota archaeon SMTZ1-45]|nr:MAG: hypothetical protein AM325_06875 [Candidatus Thorarchaeota archaeon SMTZ1-45]
MKSRTILIIMIFVMVITPIAYAKESNSNHSLNTKATHNIVIDAHSWESFSIHCHTGDTLSGEFLIVHNGELFPGDQTEYDNWLLGGIDFFVFNEENYDLWVEDSSATPIQEKRGLVELTWSIEIPNSDVWYVVYSNDSIYMKEIKGSIIRSGQIDQFSLLIVLVGLAALLSLTLIIWKKK